MYEVGWMFVGVGAGSCLFSPGRLSDSEDPTARMSWEIYLCLGSKADKSRGVIMLRVAQLWPRSELMTRGYLSSFSCSCSWVRPLRLVPCQTWSSRKTWLYRKNAFHATSGQDCSGTTKNTTANSSYCITMFGQTIAMSIDCKYTHTVSSRAAIHTGPCKRYCRSAEDVSRSLAEQRVSPGLSVLWFIMSSASRLSAD